MGNRQASKVEIPKTGPNAYDYDDNSADSLIGRGGFGYVVRATRNFDKQTFAIKVSNIKEVHLSKSEKQD